MFTRCRAGRIIGAPLILPLSLANAMTEPVNVTAPASVRNADFARALGHVLGRPAVLPTPAFALRLALGEMASMLLTGQRVLPAAAIAAGYAFAHPELDGALRASID